jgi:DNA-binding NarL/FixJ family response regulator
MDQVYVIRHKVLVEGHGIRRVAAELGICRNTIRKYLRESMPLTATSDRRTGSSGTIG